MAELQNVPLLTAPDEFADLHSGEVTLHNVPFFDTDVEGGALQVGLLPDECADAPKCDLEVTVVESLGEKAIELSRADGKPFTIEYTEDNYREPAISRPVASLRFTETQDVWLTVQTPGEESLRILERPGLNYLVRVLTMFALREQKKETTGPARHRGQFKKVA